MICLPSAVWLSKFTKLPGKAAASDWYSSDSGCSSSSRVTLGAPAEVVTAISVDSSVDHRKWEISAASSWNSAVKLPVLVSRVPMAPGLSSLCSA